MTASGWGRLSPALHRILSSLTNLPRSRLVDMLPGALAEVGQEEVQESPSDDAESITITCW